MQTESGLPREALAALVRREYGFEPGALVFWPHGEASYCYRNEDGEREVFLKVYDPRLPAQARAAAVCDRVLALIRELAQAGLRVCVPLATGRGELTTRVDRFTVVAFERIEGQPLGEKPWPGELYRGLGDSVGRLHGQTDRRRGMVPPAAPIEVPTRGAIDGLLARIEAAARSSRPARARLAREVLPRRQELYRHHGRLCELSRSVQASTKGWVLCHTDLTGWNLIVSGAQVTIIDWDSARLAPREFDLAFFADEPFAERFGPFVGAYRERCRARLNVDALQFRMYQRNLEDFVEGAEFVLEQDAADEELDHALEVALEDGV